MEDVETIGCADCPEVTLSAGGARCELRDTEVSALSRTFCANHPACGGPPVAVPLGPIVVRMVQGLDEVRDSPDTPKIRNTLLTMVEDSGATSVEDMTPREEVALWQLERWREGRAVVLSEGIGGEPMLSGLRRPTSVQGTTDWIQSRQRFASLALRTRVVVALLALNILLALAAMGSHAMQLRLLARAETTGITTEEAEVNDARQTAVARAGLAIFLVTAIAFWMWLYRAYANLRSLATHTVRHSPAFAVGAWFIPFANLVYPCTITQEIMEKSGEGEAQPMGGLVLMWWLAYLAMGVMENVATLILANATNVAELRTATWVALATELVTILAAGFAIVVVQEIRHRQNRRPDIVAIFD